MAITESCFARCVRLLRFSSEYSSRFASLSFASCGQTARSQPSHNPQLSQANTLTCSRSAWRDSLYLARSLASAITAAMETFFGLPAPSSSPSVPELRTTSDTNLLAQHTLVFRPTATCNEFQSLRTSKLLECVRLCRGSHGKQTHADDVSRLVQSCLRRMRRRGHHFVLAE